MRRFLLSWPVGLLAAAFLVLFWAWFLIYRPTIGETRRIEKIAAEFKAHGCRSMRLETVPMFENHWLLGRFQLEKKILCELDFGTGSEIPKEYKIRPPYLPDLFVVNFHGSDPTDEDISWTANLPRSAFVLSIQGSHRIGWPGFRSLPENLDLLSLMDDPSVEEDLQHLAMKGTLTSLILRRCSLNDRCFESLARLPLQRLWLLDCDRVDLDGLKKLKQIPLRALWIVDIKPDPIISDEMLNEITEMSDLETLNADLSSISVDGFEKLKKMPKLRLVGGLPPDKQAEFDEVVRKRIEATP